MYFYVLIGIIIIIILIKAFLKIKYPFWSRQPVVFYHDVYNLLFNNKVIDKEYPKKNKYYDNNVKYYKINTLNNSIKESVYKFIKNNYLTDNNELYSPENQNDIFDYLNHSPSGYISIYFKNNEIISTMSHIPNTLIINNKKLNICYIDWLCVKKEERKKGIASKTIYTHYFNTRYSKTGGDYAISLFKNEGFASPFVPLISYKTYFYNLKNWIKDIVLTQSFIKTVIVNNQNINYFIDLLNKLQDKFKIVVMSNLMNIKYLIEKEKLLVYMLLIDDVPFNFYIYNNTNVFYDGKKSLELQCSYNSSTKEEFIFGFYYSLSLLIKKYDYEILLINNISDNNNIIKNIKYNYYASNYQYYFLYNYATSSYNSNNCIIIN